MENGRDTSKRHKTAKAEIISRCRGFVLRYHEAVARIEAAQAMITESEEEKTELLKRIADCSAAARVLDFDLSAAMRAADQSNGVVMASAVSRANPQPIREMVLEFAREASPKPVRASEVRKLVEQKRGAPIHEKTIGMTLYRLSRERLMRRDGWDWYFCGEVSEATADNEKEATDP
jgi:hypothetical protein